MLASHWQWFETRLIRFWSSSMLTSLGKQCVRDPEAALAWDSPGHCSHLRTEPEDGVFLCLSLFPYNCLSNKQLNNFLQNNVYFVQTSFEIWARFFYHIQFRETFKETPHSCTWPSWIHKIRRGGCLLESKTLDWKAIDQHRCDKQWLQAILL